MQAIIFSEEYCRPENLFPFTLTRRIQDIRIGILTIREKWEKFLSLPSFDRWEGDYKESDRALKIDPEMADGHYLLIHANILPDAALVEVIRNLAPGTILMHQEAGAIAVHFTRSEVSGLQQIKVRQSQVYPGDIISINTPWDIFTRNDLALRLDFQLLTAGRSSLPISSTNQVIHPEAVFLEAGAILEHCIINAATGPVYIGSGATLMEGSMVRGGFALLEGATLKMGSRIYGATTIGPGCIAGGEIKNSVMMGYSNKAHDGYLGDAVIGEWCNLGAGTSASNLKNNAGEIYVYHPASEGSRGRAGRKCGLLMGDYSRAAINTSFNTGTVVGVSSSVFGTGLLPKYIPNFSWGAEGIRKYELDKALQDIRNWKKLKDADLSALEEHILRYIYDNY